MLHPHSVFISILLFCASHIDPEEFSKAKKRLRQRTGHLCWAILAKCLFGVGDNVPCQYRHVAVQSASATRFTGMMMCCLMQMRSEAAAERRCQ